MTYEVFLKRDGKDEFRHAGNLDAATDDLAVILARECYVRRGEGDRIWLVRRDDVIDPDTQYLKTNEAKPNRHGPNPATGGPQTSSSGMTAGSDG